MPLGNADVLQNVVVRTQEAQMTRILPFLAATALIASSTAGFAESSTVKRTPGHEAKHHHGYAASSPGASYYAPGHEKKRHHSQSAAPYAPSR